MIEDTSARGLLPAMGRGTPVGTVAHHVGTAVAGACAAAVTLVAGGTALRAGMNTEGLFWFALGALFVGAAWFAVAAWVHRRFAPSAALLVFMAPATTPLFGARGLFACIGLAAVAAVRAARAA